MNSDHSKPFLKLPIVWLSFLLITTLAVASAIAIIIYSDLRFDFSYRGFNEFIVIFKMPISIWAINIPVIAVLAANHRSVQTKKQIEVGQTQIANSLKQIEASEKQNIFTNYYRHIEEFEKYCAYHLRDDRLPSVSISNTRILHQALFPDAIKGGLSISKDVLDEIEYTFMNVNDYISDYSKNTHIDNFALAAINELLRREDLRFGIDWIIEPMAKTMHIGGHDYAYFGRKDSLRDFLLFIRWKAEFINLILNFDLTHAPMPELAKLLRLDHCRIPDVPIEESMKVKFNISPYLHKDEIFEQILERRYEA